MYIKFYNLSWHWLTYLSVLGSRRWTNVSFLCDLPAYYPFLINSVIARLIFLKYGFCYVILGLKHLQQLDVDSTIKPQSLHILALIFTGFPCASQIGILTVLQTSFHPPTFVHNFPFYGILFFPFSAYWNLTLPLKLAQEMKSDYALVFHKVLILLPFYVLVSVAYSPVKLSASEACLTYLWDFFGT